MDMASSRVKRFLAISSYSELALLSKPTTFGTESIEKGVFSSGADQPSRTAGSLLSFRTSMPREILLLCQRFLLSARRFVEMTERKNGAILLPDRPTTKNDSFRGAG
jgi:hypothetical protein